VKLDTAVLATARAEEQLKGVKDRQATQGLLELKAGKEGREREREREKEGMGKGVGEGEEGVGRTTGFLCLFFSFPKKFFFSPTPPLLPFLPTPPPSLSHTHTPRPHTHTLYPLFPPPMFLPPPLPPPTLSLPPFLPRPPQTRAVKDLEQSPDAAARDGVNGRGACADVAAEGHGKGEGEGKGEREGEIIEGRGRG
jgi:hypothetical protein